MRIFDEWGRHYAPSNFIQNEKNAKLLLDFISQNYGLVSITYLTQAATALGYQLDLVPEPKKLTVDELTKMFQEKEFKRIQRETLENSVPFSDRVKAEQTKRLADEEVKRQSDAEGELAVTISGYQAYKENGSGIDYTTTEMVQRELKTIVVRVAGKKDFVRTLAAARVVIQQIPDHPKIGDVNKIVQRIANQQREAAENPVQKDTWAQRPR